MTGSPSVGRPTDENSALYQERGFGKRIGFGRAPAILVVDMIRAFTERSSPLGSDLDGVIEAILRLLEVARSHRMPIIYTTVAYDETDQQAARIFVEKIPSLSVLKAGTKLIEVDPRLGRLPREPVIVKMFASAFFGTALSSMLTTARTDTVIVTGCTTSGCVRASVIDALQHGFRPIVPYEAVGDRAKEPHDANLFDIQAKYGDVLPLAEVLAYLQRAPSH